MKSVTEILGGAQILLGLSYDIQAVFEEYLTDEHRSFLTMLRIIEDGLPDVQTSSGSLGRPSYADLPMLRAFLAKSLFRIDATSDLIRRLESDRSLRQICGFRTIPSQATFSRRLHYFSRINLMEHLHDRIIKKQLSGHIIGHICRDSTAISAREAAKNIKKEVNPDKPKRKRGRPKKGEQRPSLEKTRLKKQIAMQPSRALRQLNRDCAWGCKRNSQGNNQFWKGYKLHLDVTDAGIPVTAVTTGANVHDSQTAIPMEKITAKRITHLYSLMDAAYDAGAIHDFCCQSGRIALIDSNKRRNTTQNVFGPAEKQRFKIRSTVERANSQLKDWLLPAKLLVKGFRKVNFVLMTAVVALSAIKILQYCVLPQLC